MTGTLYVVSTPIGNLEDLTYRAHRILQEVDIIAAEDTRQTQKLCQHYGIHSTLTSYHDFNKEQKTPLLLEKLREGKSIALVSDAGTPLISDPGYYLLTRAIEGQIPVVPIPGPSAILAALAVSGLPTDTFCFRGFLPRKSAARIKALESIAEETQTVILFETPHRIKATLAEMVGILGDRQIVIARELTKRFEEIVRGPAAFLLEKWENKSPQGEITLLIAGKAREKKTRKKQHPPAVV